MTVVSVEILGDFVVVGSNLKEVNVVVLWLLPILLVLLLPPGPLEQLLGLLLALCRVVGFCASTATFCVVLLLSSSNSGFCSLLLLFFFATSVGVVVVVVSGDGDDDAVAVVSFTVGATFK